MRLVVLIALLTLADCCISGTPVFFQVESLSIRPVAPAANQPFEITIQAFNSGCWNNQSVTTSGKVILVNLDIAFCGFNLDPFPTPTFNFQVSGLPRGHYTLQVFTNTAIDDVNPVFVSGVVVGSLPVPGLQPRGLLLLLLLVLSMGIATARKPG